MNSKLSKKSTYVMPTSKDNGREGLIQSVSPESQQEEKLPPLNSQDLKALKYRVKEARERGLAPQSKLQSGDYKNISDWRNGPKNNGEKAYEDWKDWGQWANWSLPLLIEDQIEQILEFLVNRATSPEEVSTLNNFSSPYRDWIKVQDKIHQSFKSRSAIRPLFIGLEALGEMVYAYWAVDEGDYQQANAFSIRSMRSFTLCAIHMFESEILTGRTFIEGQRGKAKATRNLMLAEAYREIKIKKINGDLKAHELWEDFCNEIGGESYTPNLKQPDTWYVEYYKNDKDKADGKLTKIPFKTYENRLSAEKVK
ncbi:hypothetical protein [Shewanella algae]|uniref:hypothetical protein n=1 Tax=Shewanella algae TaxID=38313 RepID=UPI0016870CD0|nr:hypothetical protein [Shewanella algae]MBO2579060.1 hypothetical protein [Shewanella algae]MBO2701735.1 hypothetical protein [Shewanella algae]QNV06425.1 hypothetical protein EIY89_15660 [Shewanella algae]BCV64444.1 hypothetical protein TUM17386_41150 [Shewanella algae]